MSQDPHDLLAAYALDALDDDERERFERHLDECDDCSAQLALLREPVAALAYAAEGPAPPEALRGRIIEGARAEPRAAVIQPPRRNWALAAVAGVAAVAACLAIGLGIWAHSLSNSLDRERAALRKAQSAQAFDATAINTILGDRSRTPLSGLYDRGILAVDSYRHATLVLCAPLKAPPGKAFEAWVIHRGTPRPAGLFSRATGQCVVFNLTRDVPRGATVAVTLEPAGGVPKPTGPIISRAKAV
jgi:anti-sigma-K factor RskA